MGSKKKNPFCLFFLFWFFSHLLCLLTENLNYKEYNSIMMHIDEEMDVILAFIFFTYYQWVRTINKVGW